MYVYSSWFSGPWYYPIVLHVQKTTSRLKQLYFKVLKEPNVELCVVVGNDQLKIPSY